ncbi:MAG: HAD-IIIA family hydrolase [Candidatus Alcyoniella australis]|nr:HAD-IIIA family hydrolase [Candidatus Alcyoniella australis]
MSRPAAFLDRDGTINVDKGYLCDVEQLELIPGSAEAIVRLNEAGWLVIVVSNQSGIARGLIEPEQLEQVNRRLAQMLAEQGARIDRFYHCPHLPDGKVEQYAMECGCRKPATGMIDQACLDFQIDLEASLMFGDKLSDVGLGRGCAVSAVLLLSGMGIANLEHLREHGGPLPQRVAGDLAQGVDWALSTDRIRRSPRKAQSKIVDLPGAAAAIEQLQRSGRRAAVALGAFDLLHIGQLRYLQMAAALCDELYVGLYSDELAKERLDSWRPLEPLEVRKELVAHLQCVDRVFVVDRPGPTDALLALKPDILAIRPGNDDEFRESARQCGAAVEVCGTRVDPLTSEVIRSIKMRMNRQ